MKKRLFAAPAIAVLLSTTQVVAGDADIRQLLEEGRRASTRLMTKTAAELVRELKLTGPVRAIIVCKYSAPEVATAISRETGMRVTRVSLRPLNHTIGEPDTWEQQGFIEFGKRLAKGEKPETLERSEIVVEPKGSSYRYMKAISMGEPCLVCHGPMAKIPEPVRAKLNAEYPHWGGSDFRVGQVLGAVSVKKPL